jgi:peptidylprolyl isomerase
MSTFTPHFLNEITMKKLLLIAMLLSPFAAKTQTIVQFYTNHGEFTVELYDTLMPITTSNFINLVNEEFYDGVIFHRVIEGFVIQGGDNTPVPPAIPDEFSDETSNIQKTLGMANAGPNTGNSQFYINLVNNTYLDPNYPCFGITTEGFDVVLEIGSVPTNSQDKPIDDVVMDSLRVVDLSLAISEIQNNSLLVEVYPNPFVSSIQISFETKQNGHVDLGIYDIYGRLVSQLINENRQTGIHKVIWNGADATDAVYFMRIATDEGVKTVRLVKFD